MIKYIYHKKKYLLIPERYEELTTRQFIRLAPVLFEGGEDLPCRVTALRILCGLGTFRWRLLPAEVINRALHHTDWLFGEGNLTHQLLSRYRGYYGPTSGFDNLRMREFHLSEMYYQQVINDESDTAIDHLIAVLYRRAKPGYDRRRDPDGDIRLPFNHNEVPFYARKIRRWHQAVKQAIFLWYDGCRQQLVEDNPLVFKEPSESSFQSQFDTGLYGIIRSLAGEKLGPVEKIEDMYVLTAMLELGLIKEEEKFLQEQLKSNRS